MLKETAPLVAGSTAALVGMAVRAMRIRKHLTPTQLSQATGISASDLIGIEDGSVPRYPLAWVHLLSSALGLSLGCLIALAYARERRTLNRRSSTKVGPRRDPRHQLAAARGDYPRLGP